MSTTTGRPGKGPPRNHVERAPTLHGSPRSAAPRRADRGRPPAIPAVLGIGMQHNDAKTMGKADARMTTIGPLAPGSLRGIGPPGSHRSASPPRCVRRRLRRRRPSTQASVIAADMRTKYLRILQNEANGGKYNRFREIVWSAPAVFATGAGDHPPLQGACARGRVAVRHGIAQYRRLTHVTQSCDCNFRQ